MTVAPLMETLWPCSLVEPNVTSNAADRGTEFSSSTSSNVMTSVSRFTVALTKLGAVVSAAVLLVTALGAKPGTRVASLRPVIGLTGNSVIGFTPDSVIGFAGMRTAERRIASPVPKSVAHSAPRDPTTGIRLRGRGRSAAHASGPPRWAGADAA